MTSKLYAAVLSVALLPIGSSVAAAAPLRLSEGAEVTCGAGLRPVIHRVRTNGRIVNRVDCVRSAGTTVVETRHHRSWKKSAAVIGGSSLAGAGVGALVGGKKGAVAGAAVGAGAGSVYEYRKRHRRR